LRCRLTAARLGADRSGLVFVGWGRQYQFLVAADQYTSSSSISNASRRHINAAQAPKVVNMPAADFDIAQRSGATADEVHDSAFDGRTSRRRRETGSRDEAAGREHRALGTRMLVPTR
jgi:hypothetical protein